MMMSNKPHLLIVDKDKDALSGMQEILAKSYRVACAETGAQAVEYATKICPDLILLNNSLPDCDAEKVMEEIDEREDKKQIPFIIIMDSVDYDSEVYVLPSRAMDFIVKPVIPAILQARVERVLEVQVLHQNLEGEIEKQKEQISRLSLQSVVTIAQTIDARDRYAKGHSIRVALFCREIAAKLGWDEKDIDDLYYTALLHDIGKIAVEDAILNKSSELTGEEFEQIKKHTVIGGEMVKNISFIPGVVNGVRYHHER
ncbi:MAG: HD domain-containing protein, partial [Eubacterium sp.]|nr:HD domain-containing protein [Eubacterium sp.]